MEKFVIEGGVPLSGTVEPAGNKNAALPLLACALLTDEPVTLHNVPRIRDTEALLDLLADLGVTVERPGGNTVVAAAPRTCNKTDVDAGARRADPRLVPGRRPAAGALRPRHDAAAGRRRDRPPPAGPAPRRLPRARRDRRARPRHRHHGAPKRPAPVRLLHGRAVRDGHRERADGRRRDRTARRSSATPPASRTCRTSRACSTRWARRSRASAPTSCTVHGVGRARRLRAHGLARPHRDRLVHGAGRRDRRRAADQRLRRRGPADDPAGVPPARAATRDGGRRPASSPAARRCGSSATPATTSPRSRTARGPPSRPTSRRSPWRSPRSPRARS